MKKIEKRVYWPDAPHLTDEQKTIIFNSAGFNLDLDKEGFIWLDEIPPLAIGLTMESLLRLKFLNE